MFCEGCSDLIPHTSSSGPETQIVITPFTVPRSLLGAPYVVLNVLEYIFLFCACIACKVPVCPLETTRNESLKLCLPWFLWLVFCMLYCLFTLSPLFMPLWWCHKILQFQLIFVYNSAQKYCPLQYALCNTYYKLEVMRDRRSFLLPVCITLHGFHLVSSVTWSMCTGEFVI